MNESAFMKIRRPSGQATSWQSHALSKAVPCVDSWKGMYRCESTTLCARTASGQQRPASADAVVQSNLKRFKEGNLSIASHRHAHG